MRRKFYWYSFIYCLFIFIIPSLSAQNKLPKKIKLPDILREVSGLYYITPDSLWWHNDSGDQPRLLLTDVKGNMKKEVLLAVQSKDWEDITFDNQGNIYIGDFGNNLNQRKDLKIYIYNVNDGILDSIQFAYPDQQAFPPPPKQANYDMEGFFWYNDSLHLFSKNRLLKGNYYTKHYILPARAGISTAILQDSILLKKRVVTAAAISPDNQRISLLTYYFRTIFGIIPISRATIYTFSEFTGHHFFKGKKQQKRVGKFIIPTQYESLDFVDPQIVYIASERTPLFRQQAKRVRLKLPKVRP
ncbi:MAG: hypothetical protein ACK4TA_06980 [Saprospiraceae bacterium]